MNEDEEDPISKALNVTPEIKQKQDLVINNMLAAAHDDSAKQDFELARANIIETIEKTKSAINKLDQIAEGSQHPRAYEVLGKLIETMLNANKDLLDLQEKIRKIDNIETPMSEKAKTINNNLFVGSSYDLQKILKEFNQNDKR